MATKAASGAGVQLKINTTGSTYVSIAQLKSFQFTGAKWSLDDVTHAGSPSAGTGVVKEETPTVLDYGELSIAGVWLYSDTGQQTLMTNFQSGAQTNFKLILPLVEGETTTQTEYDFAAIVTDLPAPDMSYDKSLQFKATLKLNSLPTFIVGA